MKSTDGHRLLIKNIINKFAGMLYEGNLRRIVKGKKHRNLDKEGYMYFQKKYPQLVKKLVQKVKRGEGIKVAFIVHWASVFPARPIFNIMKNDDFFEAKILVVPLMHGDEEYRKNTYDETVASLSEEYPDDLICTKNADGSIADYTKDFDLICVHTQSDIIMPKVYSVHNFVKNNILTICVDYAWHIATNSASSKTDSINLFWKFFSDSHSSHQQLEKRQPINAYNSIVFGYAKMDEMATIKKRERNRKKIIISPHHSITGIGLCSMFLDYAELFLELPKMYPDIDFVFRPHPLLTQALKHYDNARWSDEKINNYFKQLTKNKNCIYDQTGNYFDTFINSDGIINDCGSFLAEYLISGNPACYMLKDKNTAEKHFNELGQKCLKHCYPAYSKDDILHFIDEVVINEKDPLKKNREVFANQNLKMNYPCVSEKIVDYLKSELT